MGAARRSGETARYLQALAPQKPECYKIGKASVGTSQLSDPFGGAMYIIGQEEIDAVARIVNSKELFRYGIGHECERFEARYAAYLGAKHFSLAASGSYALTAAMIGLGLGPGDEVLVPAHTYMASATSVLAAGAIPVIVDVNESITIDPAAIEAAIGPRTRAVVPVHMWGTACDMDAIMEIARRRKLLVIEDACQGVGGGYKGRKLGSIGDIGAFSFNFYKNMSCGEGGGVVTNDDAVARRVNCAIDPCHAFWTGRKEDAKPFAGNGARASEFMGAILNVQLDRIEGIISAMRRERDTILDGIRGLASLGLKMAPLNSREFDCAANVFLTLPNAAAADMFTKTFPSVIAGKTGRHTYTEWDQVLMGAGAAHPLMNPYTMPANAECRKTYSKDMCARSLDILNRTILVPTHPLHTALETETIIHNIQAATRVALGGLKREEVDVRKGEELDVIKYDLKETA
jgi:dTDP-4-amino-4,6-dideoxygalactose transaminase